jgi:signal transduction histidine kinase
MQGPAVRSREQVLAAVSHDLRNPLNTILLTSATLLTHLSGDQRWRRHLEIIHRSCLRMAHLITDLLDMASVGAGRLSLQIKPGGRIDVESAPGRGARFSFTIPIASPTNASS